MKMTPVTGTYKRARLENREAVTALTLAEIKERATAARFQPIHPLSDDLTSRGLVSVLQPLDTSDGLFEHVPGAFLYFLARIDTVRFPASTLRALIEEKKSADPMMPTKRARALSQAEMRPKIVPTMKLVPIIVDEEGNVFVRTASDSVLLAVLPLIEHVVGTSVHVPSFHRLRLEEDGPLPAGDARLDATPMKSFLQWVLAEGGYLGDLDVCPGKRVTFLDELGRVIAAKASTGMTFGEVEALTQPAASVHSVEFTGELPEGTFRFTLSHDGRVTGLSAKLPKVEQNRQDVTTDVLLHFDLVSRIERALSREYVRYVEHYV